MKHVICPSCGKVCTKYGKNRSGSQRWRCNHCSMIITPKIDNTTKQLQIFLKWLFGRQTQKEMPGEGRTFRRKTAQFWNIWPMPPKVESSRDVVYVDGIYMGRKACVLICCDDQNVLGWYLCRYEHAGAYRALLSRIAEPAVVVSCKSVAEELAECKTSAVRLSCVQPGEALYDQPAENTSRGRIIHSGKGSAAFGRSKGNDTLDLSIH